MNKSSKGNDLSVVNPNAAGIDIGSQEHYVAIPEGRHGRPVESFGCVTAELERMANWLKACGVDTIAMESTGVYWIPVCAVLEDHGFEVVLVNPRQIKSTKGRKTDVQDCAWIQKLHSFGLLAPSFRPTKEIQVIRDYWRHRADLVREAATQIHLMQKSLEQMNVQLHKVLSDVSGVSGLRILRAIAGGSRDPQELATLATTGIRATSHEVKEALRGHYREQHVFSLSQALKAYDFFHERIRECDEVLEEALHRLQGQNNDFPIVRPPARRAKNQPHFHLAQELARITGVDLTQIPGISAMTAQTIIAECGRDLRAFPTEHHFASWLGLAPNNMKTGGRVFSTKTPPRHSPAAYSLRLAALSVNRSKTPLGDRFRSLRARIGTPKAITAIAHLLAKLCYRALTRGTQYLLTGLDLLATNTEAQRIQALKRRALHLGYQISPLPQVP